MKTITSSRLFNLTVILSICCIGALVLTNTVSSEAPKKTNAGMSKEAVRMFDIGLGPKTFNFQLGRDTQSRYLGTPALQQALNSAQLQPKSMISDDFNGDAMGDLVIGYGNNGAGVLGMRQGNPQAIAPTDPTVFQAITQGRFPSPFLPEVKLYQLPEAPDFLQFGDFNSDGYADVMAAARGGQRMYLLVGDGRGNLSEPKSFELPGLLTEMQAATQQLGTFTQLAVGLSAPGGARIGVYNKKDALASGPESYPMSGEVTSLAFDQLDGDGITDLAAAASSEVVVIHGRSDQPVASTNSVAKSNWEPTNSQSKPVLIERQGVPFAIRGLATGNFTFDRNQQREIALLSEDGTVHLSARGTPDTRPYTKVEKAAIAELRRSFLRDKIDMETLTAEANKFVRPNRVAGWKVAETIRGTSAYTGTGKALFQRSNASSSSTDQLLVGDAFNNTVEVIRSEREATKLKAEGGQQAADPEAVSAAGAPIAAVSMRLSVGMQPGTVVLGANSMEPNVDILTPNAIFNVNSTADLPDSIPTAANGVCQASNGLCTLRAAVMQSNHTGGSNTIMVPDGTYTLTLGPPDDEANTGGALEESGDLDIFSWDGFDGSPILNAVSITGGTRDGCIIQMGTLSPTLGTNVPNNKERILEVNDVVVIGFHRRIAVTLTNLTMQNGFSPTSSGVFLEGGAVYYDGSAQDNTNQGLLTLTNVRLSANTSAGQGGGVWAGFGSLTINSTSIVRANLATNQSGGGVAWTGGNTVENQALIINNSTIGGAAAVDGNTANDITFGAPGGVDARGGLSVTISNNSIIQNNVANVTGGVIGGGGIQINSPTVAISNTTINDNKSKSNGGGIWSSARNAVTNASSTITLTTVTVRGNQADSDNLEDPGPGTTRGDGGGIFNFFGSMIIQTNSNIDGNSADNGGGIFAGWSGIAADPTAGLTVSASTIGQAGAGNGNSARNNGGSIAIAPAGASSFNPINLNNLTFTNNTANSDSSGGGDGGAIFVGGNGQLTSLNGCTIDGNIANSGTGDGIRQTGGTITGAGTIDVNGGDSISLSGGTFTSTPVALNLTGNLLNSGGNFVHNGGTVSFVGSAAQSIGGTTPIAFNNLIINNANGVTTNTASTVAAGTLTLTNGAFAPNAAQTFTINGPVSFTSGTFNANNTSTVNYAKGSNVQAIAPGQYGNLTFSNFTKQLPSPTAVRISNVFTTGAAGGHLVTGSTVEFNGAAAQTLPSGFTTYNNLTLNNPAGTTGFSGLTSQGLLRVMAGTFTSNNGTYNNVQIDSGATLAGVSATTINVAGNWTKTGTYTANSNTVNFNGSSGTQTVAGDTTFHNLTIANAGATIDFGATNTTVGNTLSRTSGTAMEPGTGTFTFTGGAGFISGASAKTFNNLVINAGANISNLTGGNLTVENNFTNNGTFTQAAGITTTFDATNLHSLAGSGATTFGNVTISGGTTVDAGSHNFSVLGANFTVTGVFAGNTGTVTFIGVAPQTLGGNGAKSFNNLTINNGAGGSVVTSGSSPSVAGLLRIQAGSFTTPGTFNNVQIDSGATLAGVNATTMNMTGSWTNNGGAGTSFTSNGNTVNFNGSAAQTIGGTTITTFNNLTIANAGGGVSLAQNQTVNGLLTLTNDLTTGAFTLTMPATATSGPALNAADVIGNVKRTGFAVGTPLSFGNPFNTISINSGAVPVDINVNLVKASPGGFASSVDRTYTITPNGAHGPVTLRLHYLDSELDGNDEALLNLRRFNGVGWQPFVATSSNTGDALNNWLENNAVPTLSAWTFSDFAPTAANGTVTGRITDGNGVPVEGAVVRLSGPQNRKFITDANGNYRFEQVETSGFYTVTPSRANYNFIPASRSFSQIGETTEAAFAANAASSGFVNPLDTPEYFVRQNYLDFLGREPDEAGFNFWSDQIIACGGDTECVDRKRTNVSAAYFLSIEFQQTGGLVDGLYRASFGRRPSYGEFKPDAASVAPQLVVGGDGWEAALESGKTAFVDAFVQRPAFQNVYGSLSNEAYVDALIANTGVSFTAAERDAIVGSLAGGTMNRGAALRAIVENATFVNAKRNQAFVMMEYFGYLRREPDADGYDFWLNKLNHFNGNFEQAEMVRSFILSTEYRQRFPK